MLLSKAPFSVSFPDNSALDQINNRTDGSITMGKYYEVLLVERINDKLIGYFEDNHHKLCSFLLTGPGLMVRRGSYRKQVPSAPTFGR